MCILWLVPTPSLHDPEALADSMQAAHNGFDAQHDAVMQDEIRVLFPERPREFAKAYWGIMKRLSEHRISSR